MDNIYLCGHTGSENRGCEAILRSTVGLLRESGGQKIGIMTMDPVYDQRLGVDRIAEMIPYPKRTFPKRVISVLHRKFLGDGVWAGRQVYGPLFRRAGRGDVLFNVGGDTYCYSTPNMSYAMNELAQEHGIPTVFWGCSVDERVLQDPKMREDVNRYSCIVARESISYERLRRAVDDPEKVVLACDPAFWLETETVPLPNGFLSGNTVGINISPLVIGDDGDLMRRNVYELIDRILKETDMNVCLIPHVYDPKRGTEDIRVMERLYQRYATESRVSLEDRELSCCQLKYIISKCRFFVGARTHAVIGAYSSGVPALAISYSVKSIGIAKDLLGNAEDYAVQWKAITEPLELWTRFQLLMEREDLLRAHYTKVLPQYKETILTAIQWIFRSLS